MESRIINGKEFRLVTIRNRGKWISRDGEAYNPIRFNQTATIHYNPDGYPCFGGGIPVHLYVATAFVDGCAPDAEVDHIDYDRSNYCADNLRWVTHQENIKHSYTDEDHYTGKHGGEDNGRATITKEIVDKAKALFADGAGTMDVIRTLYPEYTFKQRKAIWNKFNRIKTGETWA